MIWSLFIAVLLAFGLVCLVYCVPIGEALSSWLRVRALRARAPQLLHETIELRVQLAEQRSTLDAIRGDRDVLLLHLNRIGETLGQRRGEHWEDAAIRVVAALRSALCPSPEGHAAPIPEGWTSSAGTGLGEATVRAYVESGAPEGDGCTIGLAWTGRLPPAGWDGHRDVGVLPDGSPVVWGPVDRIVVVPLEPKGPYAPGVHFLDDRIVVVPHPIRIAPNGSPVFGAPTAERVPLEDGPDVRVSGTMGGDFSFAKIARRKLADAERERRLAPLRAALARAEARINLYEVGAWPEDAAHELAEARGAIDDALGEGAP